MKYSILILFFCVGISCASQQNIHYSIPSTHQLDSLKTKLETIFKKDQTFRKIFVEAENKLGKESIEMEYFWEVVEAQDKVLEKEVLNIIDKYGWLGISQVGRIANTAQWAVLQHGSVNSKEKYAPLLKASVLANESNPNQYARLIDRMLVNANKPQLYGSQIDYNNETPIFYQVENPKLINKRRKEIGLNSIQEFAKSRKIEWKITQKK